MPLWLRLHFFPFSLPDSLVLSGLGCLALGCLALGCSVALSSVSGWKLSPVVGAVYGPELYAGSIFSAFFHLFFLAVISFLTDCLLILLPLYLFVFHASASSFQADVSLGNEAAVPLSGRGGINTYIPLISK